MISKFGCNSRGQSTVEYILLLAMVVIASNTLFKSRLFLDNFGKDGKILVSYKKQFEHAYRNGFPYDGQDHDYETLHPNISRGAGETHFFIAKDPYPE